MRPHKPGACPLASAKSLAIKDGTTRPCAPDSRNAGINSASVATPVGAGNEHPFYPRWAPKIGYSLSARTGCLVSHAYSLLCGGHTHVPPPPFHIDRFAPDIHDPHGPFECTHCTLAPKGDPRSCVAHRTPCCRRPWIGSWGQIRGRSRSASAGTLRVRAGCRMATMFVLPDVGARMILLMMRLVDLLQDEYTRDRSYIPESPCDPLRERS